MSWLFLAAYTASGAAGLIYEVAWTRLLTLHLGHTTAAASTVVGAFLLGLALGAAATGRAAAGLSRRQALSLYATLELGVAVAALALPWELAALTPLLRWAYQDGAAGWLFPLVRVLSCLPMVLLPAIALGATFPLAIRWFAADSGQPARRSAMLYATNTAGAAGGALLAGFVLIPSLGVRYTTAVAMAVSVASALTAWWIARRHVDTASVAGPARRATPPPVAPVAAGADGDARRRLWLAGAVLALSGFASLVHEIAWTRILAMVLGPTTYAFAAALAAVIAGAALGSWAGTGLLGRTRRPATLLALLLAGAAMVTSVTYSIAGGPLPYYVAERIRATPDAADAWAHWSGWLTAGLVMPTAACLGAAFTLALALAGATATSATRRFGAIYAANTIGSVAGSLAAGFVLIGAFGLQGTLQVASGGLVAAALAVVIWGGVTGGGRWVATAAMASAVVVLVAGPSWDRALLAGGGYLYAPFVPADLDLRAMLRAGTLQFYQEGAAATIAVKRLTGTTTLTVDGKTDASNRGDMLTQKLVAHLPLLLHDAPLDVAIVGLGSGVTVGAALTHPVTRADVIELSPEVVAASQHFTTENRQALADPRTHLVIGDGRSHLLLSSRRYDVIISEPSNPWIAGVATLFTREFFAAARDRLTPGGVLCQWANAYNIGEADLQSIAATFLDVFPAGTAWLVGEHDVLLIGAVPDATGEVAVADRLEALAMHWSRREAAADLASVQVVEPFSLQSLYVAGPDQLRRYAGAAPVFRDDRITLEFTAPQEIHRASGGRNGATLLGLLDAHAGPPRLVAARRQATAANWRHRGAMFAAADAHRRAYDDFVQALTRDPGDGLAISGLVRAATLLDRGAEALSWLTTTGAGGADSVARAVARSRLQAAQGELSTAVTEARGAVQLDPGDPAGLEQLATLYADAGRLDDLDDAVAALRALPPRAATEYFDAVSRWLREDAPAALAHAEQAIGLDPGYAPVYDLAGAALTALGQPDRARAMFERSLGFDAHDSAAYLNLGLLDLAAGRRASAASLFAEALWLDPMSATAREGLARATSD